MFGVSLEKKAVVTWGGHEAFGPPPVGGPAPTYTPYKKKNGRNQPFLAFYIFAPHPHPNKQKNTCLKCIENYN